MRMRNIRQCYVQCPRSYDFKANINESKMARRGRRPRRIPELEAFVVHNVQPTGVELGNGAYGAVEEVRIPGAICAAKKMHEIYTT